MTNTTPRLEDLLAGAQLPALPQSAIRLLELSQDPDNGPPEFAVPIESDPGLTVQVLRFVNSSYFGFAQEISSVRLAITLVGVRTIKNFALWSAVFSLMPNPKCGPFDLKALWQDSLRRALLARSLGRIMKSSDAEELFAASLLQDMAIPLLAKELPEEYAELLTARSNGSLRLSDLEKRRFGWTHSEAAGLIARSWNLPETFAQLVEEHTDFEKLLADQEAQPGAAAIAVSALLPTGVDDAWPEFADFSAAFERLTAGSGAALPQVLADVDTDYDEFAPVLKLSSPSRSLTEWMELAGASV